MRRDLRHRTALPTIMMLALSLIVVTAAPVTATGASATIADFESGAPVDWIVFTGGDPVVSSFPTIADSDAQAQPGQVGPNTVAAATFSLAGTFGGFGQAFADGGGSQDWSGFSAISIMVYGQGDGASYQFEIMDNRSDDLTDTAERFDFAWTDDVAGWRSLVIPFADFTRATDFQPGGAPNDGLTLTQMWGWAMILDGGAGELLVDDVQLSRDIVDDFESGLPTGTDANGNGIGFVTFNDPNSSVGIATTTTPPSLVPGSTSANTVLEVATNVVASSGFAGMVHVFEDNTATSVVPQDWSSADGFSFWLHGEGSGATLFVDILDNGVDGSTTDTYERFSTDVIDDVAGWRFIEIPFSDLARKEIGNGAPNDGLTLTQVHGWAFGVFAAGQPLVQYLDDVSLFGVAEAPELTVGFTQNQFAGPEGGVATVTVALTRPLGEPGDPRAVTVSYATETGTATEGRDYLAESGTLRFTGAVTELSFDVEIADDTKYEADERAIVRLSNLSGAAPGFITQAALLVNDDDALDPSLLDDFEDGAFLWESTGELGIATLETAATGPMSVPGQGDVETVLSVGNPARTSTRPVHGGPAPAGGLGTVTQTFPVAQDWSANTGLGFWFKGSGAGNTMIVELQDNAQADPGPAGWELLWSDEFDGTAGTLPNPDNWGYEIGDGTVNGIPGWGNSELQYYTNDPSNVSLDGFGNLVITARSADGSLECYYGPCEYTSARLLSTDRNEIAYGRIEARIQVPQGDGLWPAFWSLGTDIDEVGWPQTGEIDIMEFVGREPTTVFGTIHGPGYSGGQSYGNIYDFGTDVFTEPHDFAVEWEPGLIRWYVDGIQYHTATPADIAPNEWVFDDPIFLLLNVAVGGNFGGPVGDLTTFPQSMTVDYVRAYGAPDTAERFEASFVDDARGWRWVEVPFDQFTRGAIQPVGAPDDGLGLTDVWGYGISPTVAGAPNGYFVDQVRLLQSDSVVVTSDADSGAGSLRSALMGVAPGGTVSFDPSLTGSTILLTSGALDVNKAITIDASAASGITVDGGGSDRVLIVGTSGSVTATDLALANGYGWQVGGCVLNNGTLTLERSTVSGCTMATDAGDFWQGGGGIYTGEAAELNLVDSTISGNSAGWSGGGLYGFFGSVTTITGSTISGNSAADTGGAIRSLGDVVMVNSTVSGNISNGWHGGAMFITDGTVSLLNSTVADNVTPAGLADIFVGTFTDAPATLELTNSLIASSGVACIPGYFGGGTVSLVADHNNLFTDSSCLAGATDIVAGDALIGSLAANGGLTLTHALLAGSLAIDAGDSIVCPSLDQRDVARPQGAACDIGSFEAIP